MQRIALSWSLARPRHTACKLAGLALLVFWLVNAAHADENLAGSGSVGEWRTKLGHSELATAAYAAGVMAMGSIVSKCKNSRTVRELHAYLLYRAPSTLTMKDAIANFLSDGECTVVGVDQPAESSRLNWRTEATIYSEEP